MESDSVTVDERLLCLGGPAHGKYVPNYGRTYNHPAKVDVTALGVPELSWNAESIPEIETYYRQRIAHHEEGVRHVYVHSSLEHTVDHRLYTYLIGKWIRGEQA